MDSYLTASAWCALSLLLLTITSKVYAEPQPIIAVDAMPRVSITPQLCILKSDKESCHTEVEIHWENVTNVVCIEADTDGFTRWCAANPDQNSYSFTLDTATDVHFVLKDKTTGQQLAGIDFKTTPVAEKSVRRRYRNPWSLF